MRTKKSTKKPSSQIKEYITLTAIEDIVKVLKDSEGNDFPVIIKKNATHKIKVPIYNIGTYCQTFNPKGTVYKDRFVVQIDNLGMVLVKGNFKTFEDKLELNHREESFVTVKGFGK